MSSDAPAFAILSILGLAAFALWVWAIVDVVKVPDDSRFKAGTKLVLVIWALIDAIQVPLDSMYEAGNKLIWVLVILSGGFVGAMLYFAVGRPSSHDRSVGSLPAAGLPPPVPGALS